VAVVVVADDDSFVYDDDDDDDALMKLIQIHWSCYLRFLLMVLY
jgi:hypothetical protein